MEIKTHSTERVREKEEQRGGIDDVEAWAAFPYDHTFKRNELFYFEPARLRVGTRLLS